MTDDDRTWEITRSVSKTGELVLVGGDTLAWARALPDADKRVLYERVRDESKRLEAEWRRAFVEAVGVDDDELPAPMDPELDVEAFVRWAAGEKARSEVLASLEEILELADADQLRRLRELAEATGQHDLLDTMAEFEAV